MPIVHIYCKNNKTLDQKRTVTHKITESFVSDMNIPADAVQIFWHEIDDDRYARGGVLLVDRDKA